MRKNKTYRNTKASKAGGRTQRSNQYRRNTPITTP